MKMTQKGQVTVPRDLRKRYGMTRDSEIVFEATAGGVLLRAKSTGRTQRLARALDKARGCADAGLSTKLVMEITRG